MFSKLIHSKAVGFSLKENIVSYVLVSFYQKKIHVYKANSFCIESKAALHQFQSYLNRYPSAVSHCPNSILIKNLPDQNIPQKDKQKILNYQIASLSLNDSIIFNEPYHKNTSIAIKEKALEELKIKLTALKLNPQKIILKPAALFYLAKFTANSQEGKIILLFNPSSIDLIFIDQDQLQHYCSFDFAFNTLEQIAAKILRVVFVISESKLTLKPIEICGLFDPHFEMIDILQKHLNVEMSQKINFCFKEQYRGYLPEIGLALNLLTSTNQELSQINSLGLYQIFRKRIKAHLLLLGGTLLLCILFWQMKFNQIKISNQQLLVQNLSILELYEDQPSKFSFDQVTKLKNKIVEIQKKYLPFAYQADVPTVSEVLLYLSELNQKLHLKENNSSFIIEDFKYQLVSYPTIKSPTTPYKVQVIFSFSTDSSLTARKIHDSLLRAKMMIDTSKKVDWSYQNNCYKVSFYLKNLSPPK